MVLAMTFSYPALQKPQPTKAAAPSEANPMPHALRFNLYPRSATRSSSGHRQNQPTNEAVDMLRAVQTWGSVPRGLRKVSPSPLCPP